MKKIAACTCLFAFWLCGCATHRSVPFDCPPFDNSVLDVVIPHIKIEDASVEEAVGELGRLWQEQLAGKSPPKTIFLRHAWPHREYADTPERTELIPKVSFEKTNITVEDCLQLIAQVAPLEGFRIKRGKLVITYYMGHSEDWCTSLVPVTDKCKRFLNLADDIPAPAIGTIDPYSPDSNHDITALLKGYGIHFREGFSAGWYPQIGKIVITTLPTEIDKLRALLALVEEGYEIKRMPNQEIHGTQ